MSDYIEREKAQDGLDNIDWYHVNDKGQLLPGGKSDIETYVPFKAVEDMLKSIPAADVRPVVFCGECENYGSREYEGYTVGVCELTDSDVDAFDFCSHGEKREES